MGNSQTKRIDRTCMSFWFPQLVAAGLPVPRTTLLAMSHDALRDVYRAFDGEKFEGPAVAFFAEIRKAADEIGYPCFVRTGQTSAKHSWKETCYLPDAESIPSHVVNIVEFGECAQLIGLDCSVWAVREMLPTIPLGTCPRFGDMPLCQEFRFFVDDGEVVCWHPYWPKDAIEQGGADPNLYDRLADTSDYASAFTLAHKTGRAIQGAWSVDVLKTERGWYVTDMAEAEKSYHEEGCEEWASQATT